MATAADSSPIQLLNAGAQATRDAYGTIEANLARTATVQAQSNSMEIGAIQAGLQIAEQERMHNVQIQQMNQNNAFRAKELEVQQQLMPIQLATANVNLQATKARLASQQLQAIDQRFNSITSEFDDQMGYALLETESVDQAREYLDYKAQWKGRVAGGGNFNSIEFSKGLNEINKKYKGVTPGEEGYSPQKQFLYEQISPKLGAAYQSKNPIVAKNKNALAGSYYEIGDREVGAFASQFGSLYDPSEFGAMGSGRTVYQTNKKVIEDSLRNADILSNKLIGLDRAENPEQYAQAQSQIQEYNTKAQRALQQNNELQINAASGRYGVQPIDPKIDAPPPKATTLKVPNLEKELGKADAVYGIPRGGQGDTVSKTQRDNINAIQKEIATFNSDGSIDDNELTGLDFRWFAQNQQSDLPDKPTLSRMKNQIEENIESSGNVFDRFTKERASSLLSRVDKEVTMELSNYAGDVFVKNGIGRGLTFGDSEAPANRIVFTNSPSKVKLPDAMRVRSSDELFDMISKIKNKNDREAVATEVYASLITAATANAITIK